VHFNAPPIACFAKHPIWYDTHSNCWFPCETRHLCAFLAVEDSKFSRQSSVYYGHCRSQDPTERLRALQSLVQDIAKTATATGPQGLYRTLQGARAVLEIGQSYVSNPQPPQVRCTAQSRMGVTSVRLERGATSLRATCLPRVPSTPRLSVQCFDHSSNLSGMYSTEKIKITG